MKCDKAPQAFYGKALRELAQESLWQRLNPTHNRAC